MLLKSSLLCAAATLAVARPHSWENISGGQIQNDESSPSYEMDTQDTTVVDSFGLPSFDSSSDYSSAPEEVANNRGEGDEQGSGVTEGVYDGEGETDVPSFGADETGVDVYEGDLSVPIIAPEFKFEAEIRGQEWVPVPVGVKWQNRAWCGPGQKCMKQAIPAGAKLVNVDLFDVSASAIRQLAKRYIVTCYYSAGTYEAWRPDSKKFTSSIKGMKMSDWDETWLDIRKLDKIKPIMAARIDLAKQKGCHGVEPDNIDCWQNKCVSDKNGGDKSMYRAQLAYNKWTANYAHSKGLNIGHKNNLDQIKDLVNDYDWAMNESCHAWNECAMVSPFIRQGKAVLATEYKGTRSKICSNARKLKFSQKTDNKGMWSDC